MCSLKDLHNLFMQSPPPYTLCFFYIPSNAHIIDIDYPQGICSAIFVVDDFAGLFLYPSTFLIKDSWYA